MNHLKNMKMQLTSCVDDKSILRIIKMIRRGWEFSNSNQKKMVQNFLSSLLEGLKSSEETMTLLERKDDILAYQEALRLLDEGKSRYEEKTEHHYESKDSDKSYDSDDDSDDESNDSDDSYYTFEDRIFKKQCKLSFKKKSRKKKKHQRKQNKSKKK